MSEISFKKKYENVKRQLDKMKPYADTMARHNNRLENDNKALEITNKILRHKLQALCTHKPQHLMPQNETKWGEETRHYCGMCYQFIRTEDINRSLDTN